MRLTAAAETTPSTSRGGGADTVTCGAGKDVVLYDASDTVSGDCETASLS